MTATASFDRPAIFREAWSIAREAAARTGEAVRLFIGNALRMSWGRARADRAASAMQPTPVQQQQAQATAAGEWSVVQDYHADAVIMHTVVDGMPVLIHHGGRYPSLVHTDGRSTRDPRTGDGAMHVEVWVGGTTQNGVRVPGSDVPVIVYAHDGYRISKIVFKLNSNDEDTSIAQAMLRIGEATAAARTLRAEKVAWEAAVAPVRALPQYLSRSEYESYCAEYGVEPMTDADAKDRQADVWWSITPVEVSIREILASRRGYAVRRDEEALKREREIEWANAKSALVQHLRTQPVDRTVTMITVGPTPDEHLRGKELWTVATRGRDVQIDDDSPSIHGEHLLGYEGCTGREITFEIRR